MVQMEELLVDFSIPQLPLSEDWGCLNSVQPFQDDGILADGFSCRALAHTAWAAFDANGLVRQFDVFDAN
jgi:hypothetical protein